MALNLEKQLLFYGAYHNNPVNVAIHMTCIPMIMFTGFALATNSPALFPVPEVLCVESLPPTLGTVVAFMYSMFYILLEPVAGALISPLIIGSAALGRHLIGTYGATANYWFAGIQVVSWLLQFVGHGVFEGRAPALLDNLVQALVLAPLFVWMEILFFFGYRPELKSRYDASLEKEIAAFKEKKGKKASK
ncbi:hypothetical protein BJY04DRAFT_184221 [Aspergillus karnatakaensis]|uniref:2-hydroxy-palmitic acid dioxygenase MPO1 n=1 Tax=Aspergillus karnatakaensis TaxID=1810916 RepID=UPI003CCE0FC1